jgi:hypothetical protein
MVVGMARAKIAGVAAGVSLVAAVGASAAWAAPMPADFRAAASPSPSPGASNYCTDFVSHLASNLGLTSAQVAAGLQKAGGQTVDDAVKKGDLTAKQANAIKSRLAKGDDCQPDLSQIRQSQAGQAGRDIVLAAAAKSVDLSPQQLRTDLNQGKSVSQVAPKGMTEQQFSNSFQNNLKGELDAQVKAGNLTQNQENQTLQYGAPHIAERLWKDGKEH